MKNKVDLEKKYLDISILVLLITFVVVNIFCRILTMSGTLNLDYVPFSLYIFIPFSLIIYLSLIVYKKVKFDIFDVLIGLIFIFGIISVIYSVDVRMAILGYPSRWEGLVSLTTYYLLYLVAKNLSNEYKMKFIYIFLFISISTVIYSILQVLGIVTFSDKALYIPGVFGNANFNSSYMLMCLSLSAGLYLYNPKHSKLSLFFIALFSFALFLSNSTSGLVGLVAVIIFMFLSKSYKKILIILAIIASMFTIYTVLVEDDLFYDIFKLTKEASEIIDDGEISDEAGSSRGYIYKETFKRVPEHLLNGIGIDNFPYVAEGEMINYKGTLINKAHSELLQILITQGIFALLAYLTLYFLNVYKYLFNKKTMVTNIIFLLVIGYLAQGLFNISVICVAPIFFIFLGLLNNNDYTLQSIREVMKWKKNTKSKNLK